MHAASFSSRPRNVTCRWRVTTPRASRRRSPATAGHRRSKFSEPSSANSGWRPFPNRPMWPMLWQPRCVTITPRNCRCEEFMITKITGTLKRVLDESVRLQAGPFEYEVLVPEFIRRKVQARTDQEITLHTCHYFDGNPMQGRVVPRLIGFSTEAELDFFDLFCTVDKVGTRKALKAFVRPVKEIADAIQRQDAKWLTTLPGVGAATAEQIIATLRRKVTKFALMAPIHETDEPGTPQTTVDGNLIEDAYRALLTVGHGPGDARILLDKALATGKSFESVEGIMLAIYK